MSDQDEKALAVVSPVDNAPAPTMRRQGMAQLMKLAEIMAKGRLVPVHLQGNVADCFMVCEQADRWGLSPFAVAQCTSVIQGKLMYEGKLVAAVINALGGLTRRLDFEYRGDGNNREVRVFGTIRGETSPREVTVSYADVKTNNNMWQRQPDQQLAYSGARIWGRRHTPELMLGVYSPEEDFSDTEPVHEESRPAPQWTSGTEAAPKREPIRDGGFVDPEEEDSRLTSEYTEPVPVYDATTGEEIRKEPKLTSEQNKKIHALLRDVRNQYSEEQYRKHLKKVFSKEHTNELSIREAGNVIDGLLKRYEKIRPYLEEQAKARAAAQTPDREPGMEG